MPKVGFKHSDETKRKLRLINIGKTAWNKGLIGYRAKEKHPLWKGGIASGENRKEYMKKYNKEWIRGNRERKNHHTLNRDYLHRGATGTHSQEEWEILKSESLFMCACCKRAEPEVKLTRDHILPISRGGSNIIQNIQPLCGSCNSRKHAKYIDYISPYQINETKK